MNIEFIEVLVQDFGISKENITFITDCPEKGAIMKHDRYKGVNVVVGNFLEWEPKMKFDTVIMNPPYQGATGTNNTLWDKFVEKALSITEDNGYLCSIHPSGWRDVSGDFKKTQRQLKSKKMEYLETHDRADGVNTFGVQTAFDWYVLKNTPNTGKETTIVCRDGATYKKDISQMEFIPNGKIDEIQKLIAKGKEEKCDVLFSHSAYEIRKSWMSDQKSDIYKYPCIYTILKNGDINLKWSKINTKGHFGIPKVIWSNGSSCPIVDNSGEYGLTCFAYGIVDDVKNLNSIKQAMQNTNFISLMEQCQLIGKHRYHWKIISTFRKDFWKEFI